MLHTGIKHLKNISLVKLVLIVAFGVLGTVCIISSKAATPTISIESEKQTVTGCAAKIADTQASGGGAVKFGACSSSPIIGMDITGAKVTDTNYAIPAGAIFLSTSGSDTNVGSLQAPFRTFTKAMNSVPSGGTIVIRGGVYRDWYTNGATYAIANKPLTIQAYPHEQVWFDGTDVKPASSWTSDGAGHWSMAWDTPSFCQNAYYTYKFDAQPTGNGPCSHDDMYKDTANPAASDPQMVYVNGVYAKEVKSLAAATGGNFYYDWSAHRMYISSDPATKTIEVAARPVLLVMGGTNTHDVTIRGIGVRRYATNEQNNQTNSAITLYGSSITSENNTFKQMAGQALYVGSQNSKVTKTVFVKNGYDGMGSNGSFRQGTAMRDNLLVADNYFGYNNTENFGTGCTASCGQAGIKIAHMNGFTIKNNVSEFNNGHGFWCDLACSGGKYVNNVARGNTSSGILDEVSSDTIVASNLVYDNQSTGIRLCSANAKIYNNTVVNNKGYADIWIYDDPRSLGVNGWTDVGPDTRNVSMANNIVSSDNANLMRTQGQLPAPNTVPNQFFSFVGFNSYYRSNGPTQSINRWITPTGSTYYTTLADYTRATGLDGSSQDVSSGGDPFFVNQAAGNFAVRVGSGAYRSGTALPADVAAAIGATTAAGQDRGALSWPGR